jgi:hypothetical protein
MTGMPKELRRLVDEARNACVVDLANSLIEQKGLEEALFHARCQAELMAAVHDEILSRMPAREVQP